MYLSAASLLNRIEQYVAFFKSWEGPIEENIVRRRETEQEILAVNILAVTDLF